MIKIAIIIPCYNEEKRLPVSEFKAYFETHPEVEFILANDGSKDGTMKVLNSLAKTYPQVKVFDGGINQGKANIVRSAYEYAVKNLEFDYIGFFDADLATPIDEVDNFAKIIENKNNQLFMIAGSRVQRLGSNIHRKAWRHYFGRVFATSVSLILCMPVYDTQCGAKILRKDAASVVYESPFNSKWFFDVEIFARLILNFGYKKTMDKCFEYPLNTWIEKGDTKLKTKDFLRTPIELLKLNRLYHKKIKRTIKSENCHQNESK